MQLSLLNAKTEEKQIFENGKQKYGRAFKTNIHRIILKHTSSDPKKGALDFKKIMHLFRVGGANKRALYMVVSKSNSHFQQKLYAKKHITKMLL
jgi:hypothetical protein